MTASSLTTATWCILIGQYGNPEIQCVTSFHAKTKLHTLNLRRGAWLFIELLDIDVEANLSFLELSGKYLFTLKFMIPTI